jgi:agmatinase
MVRKVKDFTAELLRKNKFPVAMGGEHSVTIGTIRAYGDDIAIVMLDAHMDYREEYENQRFNHACVIRRIADNISLGNIALLGVRSAEKQEFEEAIETGLFYIDAFRIHTSGVRSALGEMLQYLGNRKIYLSLDMDVLDPAYAPATSTPEPFGITPWDVWECIDVLSPSLIGFDIVEVCPSYDHGETSILAAKFIRYAIERIWCNHQD